jgi:hypothetical protein
MDEGAPTASQFPHEITTSLISTNIEKHFKVPHKKESHKVKVLVRIYFSVTG